VRRRRSGVAASLIVTVCVASQASAAAAFGTIDSAGQHREHERLTRAALACAGGARSIHDCFELRSMDFLAGHDREFGGVGAPDSDEIFDPAAHCDNADFLPTDYPTTRDVATAGLVACVNHLRIRFGEGVESAGALLDVDDRVIPGEVNFDTECKVFEGSETRAKCATLEAFGRVLHGAQDFYAHSNWADDADPARPIGADNPPGLNRPAPASVLDLRSETPPVVPSELSTGCFVVQDEVPGVGECEGRVTHAALNKDNGLIDPDTGATTEPTTPRGMVGENFSKAVAGAIIETRRQWQDFQSELRARYGEHDAGAMTCALTHDDPMNDCGDRGVARILVGLAAVVVLSVVTFVLLRVRRRRAERVSRAF
jgi:hypothetical protein